MAKRGYKIQEFVAHSASVNCLNIGKKACRLFITGGDDHKVNLWTIGKPTSLMSLSGHTSPVESVAFDSAEVLVLGGASTGVIKLWDLEEAKMVRTVAGHRSNCTAVEFHPFGEFFASGSMDTNLKIWDIRKKGCIHTYKGHSQGISTIKFTPDGRWVVSGGLDNVVKVWDLTAGKLLHDFKFHEGPIRSIDFHPLEFLLATGSADRTVKFWDLETFELIGSARREASGVRSIAFHPDGRTLFTGHEDGLKVYSWEPVICHDTVDMGWTTLGDLCIHDGKLLGCSFYRNSVGIWVADISLIEPYGAGLDLKKNEVTEQKHDLQNSKLEKVEVNERPTSGLRSMSPDESKEIKNIYIDSSGGRPFTLPRSGSLSSEKADLPEEFKEICNLGTIKQSPLTGVRVKSNEQAIRKSFIAPNIVPRDVPEGKVSEKSEKETITFSKTKPGMLLKPAHVRRASTGRFDVDRFSEDMKSGTFCDPAIKLDSTKEAKFQTNLGPPNEVKESCEDKHPIKSVTDKFDKILSPSRFSDQKKCDKSSPHKEESSPVKYVNGVAVVRGRTRSLVERFERREKIQIDEDQTNVFLPTINETREKVHHEDQIKASPTVTIVCERREKTPLIEDQNNLPSVPKTTILETDKSPDTLKVEPQISIRHSNSANEEEIIEGLMQTHDVTLSNLRSRLTKLQVVRHFWERNDIKGATSALRKLPDQSVQADVISVLVEKMEIFTMDLFSCLLPVLTGLLDSKIERHAKVSLDMLLKLVAVFGPTIRATVSAPPPVGVDLHQEERRECCNQCFMELQKIQMILPILIRRGGLLARSALELNLVLQQS
ncbi:katanin p80 WD40 repeat-containing subunit B1 homolog isoform X1 [Vigna radiata var. radiata]|uniref:Katanin p80 WD40 repeat-containing subunit B1 homolog n=2 Tax=Vigna radiata var. radiata TaxID=3916 RepID=A0A1S3VJM7_VIGRR|nr:katanin p80 WD40 repeat-containing subunit B1 homolog isoform X1 [Vigna radiata var. radiata]